MNIPFEQIRNHTPACRDRIHLNNAGASLSPAPVVDTVSEFLTLEQQIGGYEAELARAQELDAVYTSLAKLIRAKPQEIAITQNATRAWDGIFYGIPLSSDDKILTCRSEYASNFIAFLQRSRATGAKVVVIDEQPDGSVCLESLARELDGRVKLVAINHLPTNSGLIQPAEQIGELLADHPAFYLLDACQSVGHLPLDVNRLRCDALTGTSRKYLRGPRGVGFLYIREDRLNDFEPPMLDLHAATWVERDRYEMRDDARRFETYEIFVAGKLGLGAAAEYALQVGVEESWQKLALLAEQTRDMLKTLPGVCVHDIGTVRSGIVTFTKEGLAPAEIRQRLYTERTNVWTSTVRSARLDMEARNLDEVVRASIHYFNTEQEIDMFLSQVAAL